MSSGGRATDHTLGCTDFFDYRADTGPHISSLCSGSQWAHWTEAGEEVRRGREDSGGKICTDSSLAYSLSIFPPISAYCFRDSSNAFHHFGSKLFSCLLSSLAADSIWALLLSPGFSAPSRLAFSSCSLVFNMLAMNQLSGLGIASELARDAGSRAQLRPAESESSSQQEPR